MTDRTYPHGVPCWVDTEQPDVDAATTFYGGLFGWTFDGHAAAGRPRPLRDRRRSTAVPSRRSPAPERAPRRGTPTSPSMTPMLQPGSSSALGATVLSAPADAGEAGRAATLADPEGIELRLWEARRRLGAQVANEPGSWNFSDLYTRDASAAAAFYEAAFGWSFDDRGLRDADPQARLRRPPRGDDRPGHPRPAGRRWRPRRASRTRSPGSCRSAPDERPHWHVSFAVADRDQTVRDAQRLGAEVLAQDDTDWTRTALVRDPQGAELTASQFTPGGA